MLSALLILMTGFVGGVAVTVALGVGLYFVVRDEGDETKDCSPPSPSPSPSPTKAPASPEATTRTDYGAFTPRPTPPSPQPRSYSVDLDPWRY